MNLFYQQATSIFCTMTYVRRPKVIKANNARRQCHAQCVDIESIQIARLQPHNNAIAIATLTHQRGIEQSWCLACSTSQSKTSVIYSRT
jgi:hypothetical protein